jgi:hypothetical protein
MQPAEMTAFITQAETAMSERFDNLEPTIYSKGKQCLVLQDSGNYSSEEGLSGSQPGSVVLLS